MFKELNVGDKVSQVPNGFSVPFEVGTVTSVQADAEGNVSYNVLWDGFDWETISWKNEDLILLEG